MASVVGVDGARSGWVSVQLLDGRFAAARYDTTLFDLLAATSDASVIAIDLPIGLADTRRDADLEGRRLLGPRRSSLFPMPPRELAGLSYDEARRRWGDEPGSGYSKQTWAIVNKVVAAAELIRDADSAGERIIEVHPELSFLAMNGGVPLATRKWTWNGHVQRRWLLARHAIVLPDDVGDLGDAAPDDVLDAAAAAWSADRFSVGIARAVPETPTQLDGNRPICIWR
jgi:predicted RNase H-like nuclease